MSAKQAQHKTLARLQASIDRRCDAEDFPPSTARRKAIRLYDILARRAPKAKRRAFTTARWQMSKTPRGARFFEAIVKELA